MSPPGIGFNSYQQPPSHYDQYQQYPPQQYQAPGPPGGGFPGQPGMGYQAGGGPPSYSFGTGRSPPNDGYNGGYGGGAGGFGNGQGYHGGGGGGAPPHGGYNEGYYNEGDNRDARDGGGDYKNDARPQRPQVPMPSAPPFTAFVGNFPYECSKEEIVGLFTANGCAISEVRMVRNRDTDRPRGYFIEFEDIPSLERCLSYDKYNMGGRPLRINVAEGRPERRDRYGGGGGGFADRYNDSRGGDRNGRTGGGFAERYNETRGGRGGRDRDGRGSFDDDGRNGHGHGGSFGKREGASGYQEAHGERGRGRRSFDRGRHGSIPSDAPPPEGRKKLQLKPRSADADAVAAAILATSPPSSKPNPFGSARPVDTAAKDAEAERKIQEEKDKVNGAKTGAKMSELPAPKPLSKAATQPPVHKTKGPLIMAPKEEPHIEAHNAFALLSMDEGVDTGDDTGGEEEE